MDNVLRLPLQSNMLGLSQRQPPVNVEAEQALLGAILSNNKAFAKVVDFLLPEHFADPVHATVFTAICRRINAGLVADPVTLHSDFENTGLLDDAGGTAYLGTLLSAMVGIVNAGDYGFAIYECWMRRKLIEAAEHLTNQAFGTIGEVLSPRAIIDQTVLGFDELLGNDGGRHGISIAAAADAAIQASQAKRQGAPLSGRSTGMASVDEVMGGLENGTFNVLAGRPGAGKTALACQWAVNVARACQAAGAGGVLGFSLEMSAMALARRVLSEVSRIPVVDIKRGRIEGRTDKLIEARHTLKGLPLWIEDAGGQSLPAIRQKCRAATRRYGSLALVWIDHIQIVAPEEVDRRNGGTQAVGRISNALRDLSKEFDCPVLCLSQLNRGLLARDDKRPNMGDLRQAGDIEQDADTIAFVHREEMFLPKSEPAKLVTETIEKFDKRVAEWRAAREAARGKVELIFDKVRDGEPKTVMLEFDGQTTSFSEPESSHPSPSHVPPLSDWHDSLEFAPL